jgi:hypothetical protein
MLPLHLQTNEVKNAAGTEVEFLRFDNSQPRKTIFHKSGEAPNLRHILEVAHIESGTGLKRRRRSKVGFRVEHLLADGVTPGVSLGYQISDSPVGAIADLTQPTLVLAYLMSFVASLGASTTILYDGTGYGAASLINGTN